MEKFRYDWRAVKDGLFENIQDQGMIMQTQPKETIARNWEFWLREYQHEKDANLTIQRLQNLYPHDFNKIRPPPYSVK